MMSTTDDKENISFIRGDGAHLVSKPAFQSRPPTPALPKLCLGEFQKPLYLDFRTVDVGSDKTVRFLIELLPSAAESRAGHGAVTLEVDRAPKNIQIELSAECGSVTWTPEKAGVMREVVLLRMNGRHRVQITIHGQAVGESKGAQEARGRPREAASSSERRRPLRAISCPPERCNDGNRAPPEEKEGGFEGRLSKLSSNFKALEEKLDGVLSDDGPSGLSITIPDRPTTAALEAPVASGGLTTPTPRGRAAVRLSTAGRSSMLRSPPRSSSMPPAMRASRRAGGRVEDPSVASFRQERALTQWLNFVLCPPSVALSLPHPADFIRQQHCEVRARARELFSSPGMASIRLAVDKEIAAKKLVVREDKDMYADLNLREAFIELLFSYQLPWLQLGLEVVLGIDEICKTAKKDGQLIRLSTAHVLRKLIVQRVLSDPDTVATFRTRALGGRSGELYRQQLRANTMRRFFALVLFLDRAKLEEMLPSKRALFKPSAVAKSSAEVLLAFSKDYLSGEGNLLRHLSGLGLTVSHVQTFLDEFDFKISSLSTDLRDGVRLARLVDEMQKDEASASPPVCSLLRVPPVSRLQKVHNAKVALDRLVRGAGLTRLQRLTPDDVVDGHREKTISIIWELIRHYNLEHMVASLSGINQLQALVRRRIMQRHYQRLRNLALILQRLYRSRRVLIRCRCFSPRATILLQSQWRGAKARAAYHGQRQAAVLVQASWRGHRQQQAYSQARSACLLIQAWVRGWQARRRWVQLRLRLVAAQALWRGHSQRTRLATQHTAARQVQAAWRRCVALRRFQAVRRLSIRLQALARGHQARQVAMLRLRSLLVLQHALRARHANKVNRVRQLQALWRGHVARKVVAESHAAATTVQTHWRAHHARAQYHAALRAIVRAQALGRAIIARRAHRALVQLRLSSAIALQRCWRGASVRLELRKASAAATAIQARWRCAAARSYYLSKRYVAIRLQALVRAHLALAHYRRQQAAQRLVARVWRGHSVRSDLHVKQQAAIRAQQQVRGWLARRRRREMLHAIVLLQTTVRARQARARYVQAVRHVILLQCQQRRRAARQALQRLQLAKTVCRLRHGHKARRQVRAWHAAALVMQRAWRGARVRLALKREAAAQAMQRVWRGKALRLRMQRLVAVVVAVQRGTRRMLRERERRAHEAATVLSRLWRGVQVRQRIALWHRSATDIKRVWRGGRARALFQYHVALIVRLQAWARGRQTRDRLDQSRRGMTRLQAHVRGRIARRRLGEAHHAAHRLQTEWRRCRARSQYYRARQLIIGLQSRARQSVASRKYHRLRQACITVQRHWRLELHRRAEASWAAALLIQRMWRGKVCRVMLHTAKAAATLIQATARRAAARRAYLSVRQQVIMLQSHARGFIVRRAVQRWQRAASVIQTTVRDYQYRCKQQQHAAATLIQSVWRSRVAQQQLAVAKAAATAIQAAARRAAARHAYLSVRRQVIMLQSHGRGLIARRAVQRWHQAASLIQAAVRDYQYRCKQQQHAAASLIQSLWRSRVAQRQLAVAKTAATAIQAMLRGHVARQGYLAERQTIIALQARCRMLLARSAYLTSLRACCDLQRVARGMLVRRQVQAWARASVTVQKVWRGTSARLSQRRRQLAAVAIQAAARASMARAQYQAQRRCIISVQAVWRGRSARCLLHRQAACAVAVQRVWRGQRQLRNYRHSLRAIRTMQAWMRQRLSAMRWQAGVQAVTVLQRHFRFRRLVRAMAAHREAVITVQSLWRGRRVRSWLQQARQASVRLQAVVRARQARKRFLGWKRGIRRAQALVRAYLARRRCGSKLRVLRSNLHAANQRARADPSLQIGNRHRAALDILLNSKSCSHILKCCVTLEISTRLSRVCCEALVSASGMEKLLSLIRSCNRSTPHMELLRHVLRVLQNVAAYDHLVGSIGEVPHIVDTLVELLQNFREKDMCSTFMPASLLLLRVTSTCPLAKVDLCTSDVQRRLSGILRLLQRKAEQERASKSTRWHKAADREITALRPMQVLQKLVSAAHD